MKERSMSLLELNDRVKLLEESAAVWGKLIERVDKLEERQSDIANNDSVAWNREEFALKTHCGNCDINSDIGLLDKLKRIQELVESAISDIKLL